MARMRTGGSDVNPAIRFLFHAGLIAATPWVQLALNPSLFVTPGGNRYLDPWVYTGMFLSLPDFFSRFPDTYYGSRLSWLVPGYLAHQSFPPLVANYVLHLTFFYALLIATYYLVAASNRSAAMLVTSVVAWNPVILTALSWDYVDGAGIVYIVGTLLCLEKAVTRGPGRWIWSSVAGAMMASMACSNLFLVVTWPLFALFLVLRRGTAGPGDLSRIVGAAVAGGALAFGGFACISVALGGRWLFLAPQLRFGRSLMAAPNPWQLAGYSWLRHASWLVLPAVATAGAAVDCMRWSRLERGFARTMQAVTLAAVAVWAAVQVSGTPVFQISYYSSYLAPFALIALALHGNVASSQPRARAVLLLELATFCAFTLGYWLITSDVATFWNQVQVGLNRNVPVLATWIGSAFDTSVVCGLGAGVLMIVAVQRLRAGWARWAVLVVCLSIIAGAAPPDLPSKADRIAKPYFENVVAAHRFIADHVGGRSLRIWSSDPRGNTRPIIGTASTYLWEFALVNYELPLLDKRAAALLTRDTRLVLLVPSIQDADTVRVPLRQLGYDFNVVAARDFGAGDLAMSVVIADLR